MVRGWGGVVSLVAGEDFKLDQILELIGNGD